MDSINKGIMELANERIKEHGLVVDDWKVFEESHEFEVEAKADDGDDSVKIKGYLSTFENVDRQGDIVSPGAFDKTVKGLTRLPMLKDHTNMTDSQIGSWTKFAVNKTGLYVEGKISRTEQTAHLIKLIEDGHLNTLSMGGMFRYGGADKKGRNLIEEVMLLEGSVVSIPANPKAQFSAKSLTVKPSQVEQSKSEGVARDKAKEAIKLLFKKGVM